MAESLLWFHALFAVLAAFRLTGLFVEDNIWTPVRKRFPKVHWHCGHCMSIWGSVLATAFFFTVPWLNWSFALSFLYLAYQAQKLQVKRHMTPEEELKIRAQAESAALSQLLQLMMSNVVVGAGEQAVLRARAAEQVAAKEEEKKTP